MTITRNFSVLANGAGSANNLSLGGATLGSNALAVTGTAAISGAVTTAGVRGTGTTGNLYTEWTNTGNDSYFGIETSVGGSLLTGTSAYATVVGTASARSLQLGTNNTVRMTIDSGGSVTLAGRITNSVGNNEYILRGTGATTGFSIVATDTTGGTYLWGAENSTGNNLITGDTAYDMVIRGPSGIAFSANAGSTQQMRLTSAGVFSVQTGLSAFYGDSSGTNYSAQFFNKSPGASGTIDIYVEQSNGTSSGTTGTMRVSKAAVNSRSINATGTINASGADYAEYMVKAEGCGSLAKGDIVGIDADGNLTDKYDDAHSFVIKSTNPSYVGGDSWSDGNPAVGPRPEPTSTEDEAEKTVLEAELVKWKERHEAARAKVDRIAFSGQVPVNVTGATVGDYIVPVAGPDGGIAGEAVTNPTFDQYRTAVGRVWKIQEDGRAFVKVL